MSLKRLRTLTLLIAACSLASSLLSSVLLHQIPAVYDVYHVAAIYAFYLHFANVLSFFGLVAALRQHALSVSIFSNYLMFEAILCSIPRFLIYMTLELYRAQLCDPSTRTSTVANLDFQTGDALRWWKAVSRGWGQRGCETILWLVQITSCLGIVAATVVQLGAAMTARDYANKLLRRERMGVGGLLGQQRVSWEEGDDGRRLDGIEVAADEKRAKP